MHFFFLYRLRAKKGNVTHQLHFRDAGQFDNVHAKTDIKYTLNFDILCVKALGHDSLSIFNVGLKNTLKIVLIFFSTWVFQDFFWL